MKPLFEEILRVVISIWNLGNLWLRRIAIFAIALPLTMLVAAMLIPQNLAVTVIPILALLPIAALIAVGLNKPLFIAAAATVEAGRKAISAVSLVLSADLVFGVYLSLVPISNDRGLVPLFVLALVTVLFLWIVNARGFVSSLLMLLAVGITVIFFLGGRGKVTDIFKSRTFSIVSKTVPVPQFNYQIMVCDDAWKADIHHDNADIDHFTVTLHDGCFSGYIYLPKKWPTWGTQPVGNDQNIDWIAYWFPGSTPQGPYRPGQVYNLEYHPRQFRLQGHGTYIFYSNVAVARPQDSSHLGTMGKAEGGEADSDISKNASQTPVQVVEQTCPNSLPEPIHYGDFTFTLTHCGLRGNQVRLSGNIQYDGAERVNLYFHPFKAYDDTANVYEVQEGRFGSSENFGMGHSGQWMSPHTSTPFSLVIGPKDGSLPPSTTITLVMPCSDLLGSQIHLSLTLK